MTPPDLEIIGPAGAFLIEPARSHILGNSSTLVYTLSAALASNAADNGTYSIAVVGKDQQPVDSGILGYFAVDTNARTTTLRK
jgi:hypothetical protein